MQTSFVAQKQFTASRIAKASLGAPLLVVVPLMIFIAAFPLLADIPALKENNNFILIFFVGVVPIYFAIAIAYFIVALALRLIGRLTIRWLFVVGGVVSLIIGWQFASWGLEADPSSTFFSQIKILFLSAIGYFTAFSCVSALWWRIARGNRNQLTSGLPK